MNIFVLDTDPVIAAQYHCDKHVIKMILEHCQLLSTAHRILDGQVREGLSKTGRKRKEYVLPEAHMHSGVYQVTHANHPSAIWARKCSENYMWLYTCTVALCVEYTHRYGKTHKCQEMLNTTLWRLPKNIKISTRTPFAQAMPDACKRMDPVEGYREYYRAEKRRMACWAGKIAGRPVPSWYF